MTQDLFFVADCECPQIVASALIDGGVVRAFRQSDRTSIRRLVLLPCLSLPSFAMQCSCPKHVHQVGARPTTSFLTIRISSHLFRTLMQLC